MPGSLLSGLKMFACNILGAWVDSEYSSHIHNICLTYLSKVSHFDKPQPQHQLLSLLLQGIFAVDQDSEDSALC